MKDKIVAVLKKIISMNEREIENSLEIPPNPELGDYAFPCFILAKKIKKNPIEIAQGLSKKIHKSKEIEKIEAVGPYINFFLDTKILAEKTISEILKEKNKYGSQNIGKGRKVLIEFSSPNIAKPFGIGHLRSTIIGNSLSKLANFLGYETVKINYLGDWGTQFGKLIIGYKKFGDKNKLKKDPVMHLLDLYVKVNNSPELEQEARDWFLKLEEEDEEALEIWKKFRILSIKEFEKIYNLLDIKFDIISGESAYNKKIYEAVYDLEKKGLLRLSDGATVVDLERYGLGVCLVRKSDGATLYSIRDIAAAIDRYKKYNFHKMIYEVGSEQKLHFKQFFKILELMRYYWAKDCLHVIHGLYLDKDGKKFSTRKGKTVLIKEVIEETINLAKQEISKREKLPKSELEKRAKAIGLAALLYGDLKNFREQDIVFDIERFLQFEGNTGPYLLYTYARAKNILRKAKTKNRKPQSYDLNTKEKSLISKLSAFTLIVKSAYDNLAPNIIANYTYGLAKIFNEFYHSEKVIGSKNEKFRLALVEGTAQVIKNSLNLLGISVIEKM